MELLVTTNQAKIVLILRGLIGTAELALRLGIILFIFLSYRVFSFIR